MSAQFVGRVVEKSASGPPYVGRTPMAFSLGDVAAWGKLYHYGSPIGYTVCRLYGGEVLHVKQSDLDVATRRIVVLGLQRMSWKQRVRPTKDLPFVLIFIDDIQL